MAYSDVGPRGPVLGVSDAGFGVNPFLPGTGWDVIIGPAMIASNLTNLEVYHIALNGPIGSSLIVMRDGHIWDYVSAGWANGWDPSEPMPLGQTNTLQFCWNVAATNPPYNSTSNVQPTVTIWLRQQVVTYGMV